MFNTSQKEVVENAILKIAYKHCKDAFWSGNACNWLGFQNEIRDHSKVRGYSLQNDVYEGTAGIALFLALVYKFYPDKLILRTAIGALHHAYHKNQTDTPDSFFSGTTGRMAVFLMAGQLLDQPEWVERAMAYFSNYKIPSGGNIGKDIMNGAPGIIIILVSVAKYLKNETNLEEALSFFGDLILDRSTKEEIGYSWKTIETADRHLTGFAHGASGFAYALCKLGNHLGAQKYIDVSKEAFRYEDHLFSREANNWPDFRSLNSISPKKGTPSFMTAWCHGAPGIVLSKLQCYKLTKENEFLTNVGAGLETTFHSNRDQIERGYENYSLCHGIFGNNEVLYLSDHILNQNRYSEYCEFSILRAIEFYSSSNKNWPCGIGDRGETPGLILGTAGIGYHMLSILNPEIPNLLSLDLEFKKWSLH